MNTVLLWLLVAVSTTNRSADTLTVVARFENVEECQRVAGEIPNGHVFKLRCIQARVSRF